MSARAHHADREEKWAMWDDGPPMSTTPRSPRRYFPPAFGNPTTRSPGQILFFVNHPRGISSA